MTQPGRTITCPDCGATWTCPDSCYPGCHAIDRVDKACEGCNLFDLTKPLHAIDTTRTLVLKCAGRPLPTPSEHIMSMPSESEQTELSEWDDEQRNMRITDKIKKMLSEAEQRILQENVAPIQEKVFEHDGDIAEVKGFAAKLRRALFGVVK